MDETMRQGIIYTDSREDRTTEYQWFKQLLGRLYMSIFRIGLDVAFSGLIALAVAV